MVLGTVSSTRYVVGIDLGTSNTAVAFADLEAVRTAGRPRIDAFEVPQLVAPGDAQPRRLLPSALYVPADFELGPTDRALPWSDDGEPEGLVLGALAQRLGAKTPVRLVESSKSWLCHGGVDRTGRILPWHGPEEIPKRSPVDVAAALLTHVRAAWDHEVARGDPERALDAQAVILTVPASFDEVARRLTLDAARRAGLGDVHLIEEPVAAFYAFVARTGGTSAATGISGGDRILVADVGGGTTDFTLVEATAAGDDRPLGFERTAVGEHLLLGGDNMDLALAHAVEPALSKDARLDAQQWAQLKLECRAAKETLFSHPDLSDLSITIAGRGKKLIGGSLKASLTRPQLDATVVEGYFPDLPPGDEARPAARRRAGFTEYGLPYASDPRITRHLADFLLRHAEPGAPAARVDAVLFNGGALKPPLLRDRICGILGRWLRATTGTEQPDPRPLVWDEGPSALELAVARGAAYFGLVREGLGLRVGGGSPREYFLGLGADPGETLPENKRKVVCIAPRGMQDGQTIEVREREFQLVTNRPVAFPLYATTSPRQDPVGSVQVLDAQELHELPPLHTVLKFGKQKAGTKVPVRIQVTRTELGTLELSCLSKMSGSRFRLELDVRAPVASEVDPEVTGTPGGAPSAAEAALEPHRAPPEEGDVAPERLEAAKARLDATFRADPGERLPPAALMKGLEADLGLARDAFPLITLRSLAEHVLELADHRGATPELEARWLNAVGFFLRPGFGLTLDDWRVKQLWRIHGPGPHHPGHDPVALNWWILWRRVAGGLGRGPQDELTARLFPLLVPALHKRAKQKPPKPQTQEAAEMWRAAAALERISAKQRAQLGGALMELVESKRAPRGALWCLSRIGARRLLYGPRDSVVKPAVVAAWLERLYAVKKLPKGESPVPAVLALARRTGDRQLDLSDGARAAADAYLAAHGAPEGLRRALTEVIHVDRSGQSAALGDTLPVGISLA